MLATPIKLTLLYECSSCNHTEDIEVFVGINEHSIYKHEVEIKSFNKIPYTIPCSCGMEMVPSDKHKDLLELFAGYVNVFDDLFKTLE